MIRRFITRNPITTIAFSLLMSFSISMAIHAMWPFLATVLTILLIIA